MSNMLMRCEMAVVIEIDQPQSGIGAQETSPVDMAQVAESDVSLVFLSQFAC